jgi:AcrR family transcriptional regulator
MATPPRSKEEVVQEFRIQSIQQATMRVIARKGMAAATMQEIADEAGVAKGTIYLYFRDRDELVEKTFDTAITELHKRVDAEMSGDGPFGTRLRAMITAVIEYFREHRAFFRLYASLRIPEGTPQQQRRQQRNCQPQYQNRIERFATVLQEAMDRGEIRQMNSRRLALFVIEGINAIVIDRVMEEAPPSETEDVELMATVILDGIATTRSTN